MKEDLILLLKSYRSKLKDIDDNSFRIWAESLGSKFVPEIRYGGISKSDWLRKVEKSILLLGRDKDKYESFVSEIITDNFKDGECNKNSIGFINKFFPNLLDDIILSLCNTNDLEKVIDIVDCMRLYPEERKSEIFQIIKDSLSKRALETDSSGKWKYFDFSIRDRDNFSLLNPEDISKDELKSQLKDFSEGSVALEMCLRVLWKRNVPTKACCKGAHLSYTHDGYVSLAVDPYIAFMPGCEWQKYLPKEILEDEDVFLDEDAIHYFGNNIDEFFYTLAFSVIVGEKDNSKEVSSKFARQPESVDLLLYQSYVYSLNKVGFDSKQCETLAKEELDLLNAAYLSREVLINAALLHQDTLKRYVEENNQKLISSKHETKESNNKK